MRIIVVGAGKVGYSIIEQLANEGHDITAIDRKEERIDYLANSQDVIVMAGNGANVDLLRQAGAGSADLVIAATGYDEVNMVCCLAAKHLGTKHTVARLKNPDYIKQNDFLLRALGISISFSADYEAAEDISRILRFPTADSVDTFACGLAELVEYHVPAGSRLDGITLNQMDNSFKSKILVCAIERGGKVIVPNGNSIVAAGDKLSISGGRSELRDFFIEAGAYKKSVKNVMILGGSRIAVHLALQLVDAGIRVSIIEENPKRCDELAELLPRVNIICGDGTRREVLMEERVGDADAFVALTGYDEDNIILSMYAQSAGVRKVITKVNEDHLIEMLERTDLDCFICPRLTAAQRIVQYVRALENAAGSSVETLYRIVGNRVEALEFIVSGQSKICGRPIKELKLKPDYLFAAVIHGRQCIIPDGSTVIHSGDRAVIVTTRHGLTDIDAILE
ncbi:MAG: Trk system potassium transporter TrkA [Oscillospiraceae bacterium]|nr:Trk system potassium transporter TrkA [Oscillospiraceae bacterium]